MDRPDRAGVGEQDVGCARIVAGTDERERHCPIAGRRYRQRRIGHVRAGHAEVALVDDGGLRADLPLFAGRDHARLDDEPRDAGLLGAADAHACVERAPDLAVRVVHLLHPAVVAVELTDHFGLVGIFGRRVGRGTHQEELEARRGQRWTRKNSGGRVVQALPQRPVLRRILSSGPGLIRVRRDAVCLGRQRAAAENEGRVSGVE